MIRILSPGAIASTALLFAYLGVITLVQGWSHAGDQLRYDAWFIGPITAGFGGQVAMLVYLRKLHHRSSAGMAVTAGSTGMGGGAMLVCCAHHIADIIPLVGASGAAIFLNDFKTPFALVGVVMSAAGVLYLALKIRRVTDPEVLGRQLQPRNAHL